MCLYLLDGFKVYSSQFHNAENQFKFQLQLLQPNDNRFLIYYLGLDAAVLALKAECVFKMSMNFIDSNYSRFFTETKMQTFLI